LNLLQSYVEKIGNDKLKVVFKRLNLGGQSYQIATKEFILPNDRSRLNTYAAELFTSNPPINAGTKTSFQVEVIDYILNQVIAIVDPYALTEYIDNKLAFDITGLNLGQSGTSAINVVEKYTAESDKELENYENVQNAMNNISGKPIDSPTSTAEISHLDRKADDILEDTLIEIYAEEQGVDLDNLSQEELEKFIAQALEQISYSESEEELDTDYDPDVWINQPDPEDEDDEGGSLDDGMPTATHNAIIEEVEQKPIVNNQAPVVNQANLSFERTKTLLNMPAGITVAMGGINGDALVEPVPAPIYYAGDSFVASENNSGLICSRDEHYRMRGHTRSGAIYLYAGRDVHHSEENLTTYSDFDETTGEPRVIQQPNNLVRDAAYVYLSQKCDIDSTLRVAAKGTYGKLINRLSDGPLQETRQGLSLAAIKADDITLMSRVSGIRLITGTDTKNSRNADQNSKFGIDLIAGNDDSDLQPLVKGDNLKIYLENLSAVVSGLEAVLYDFISSQLKFNGVVRAHQHYDPFCITMGFMKSNGTMPLSHNEGKNYPSIEVVEAGTISAFEGIRQQANITSIIQNRINNDFGAFGKIGEYRIQSPKNRTN
jgi:hypothetical protein